MKNTTCPDCGGPVIDAIFKVYCKNECDLKISSPNTNSGDEVEALTPWGLNYRIAGVYVQEYDTVLGKRVFSVIDGTLGFRGMGGFKFTNMYATGVFISSGTLDDYDTVHPDKVEAIRIYPIGRHVEFTIKR